MTGFASVYIVHNFRLTVGIYHNDYNFFYNFPNPSKRISSL